MRWQQAQLAWPTTPIPQIDGLLKSKLGARMTAVLTPEAKQSHTATCSAMRRV